MASIGDELQRRLAGTIAGEFSIDPFTRGRYATDASHYQVMPAAVAVPETVDDISAIVEVAREEGVAVTMRGGGTSQAGQTVNSGIVVDTSKHLNGLEALDLEEKRCRVRPGMVLDELNRRLRPEGLWFPVDISTASRATIGGMAGNNSCGARSLRYGTMRDNVSSIEAILAGGERCRFGASADPPADGLARDMLALGARMAPEVEARFPKVQRRVGGYNLDALAPPGRNGAPPNLAHLLVGSEGTLALFTEIELTLAPLMGRRAVGVCHFGSFRGAMDAARHLVALQPVSVELVDRTMIALGREIPIYRDTLNRIVRGDPDALLVVEFDNGGTGNAERLQALDDAMAGLGVSWNGSGSRFGGVVPLADPALQAALTEVRQGGLNIMMSMKTEGKPVSFVEDCAVPLEHLADYTERLTALFARHGTTGTWYAHASVGCLHVRPVLNLKLDKDVAAMRAIAEEAFAMVREFKGSHSGEHGDGIVRSEFHEAIYGRSIVRAFEEVKDRFDPANLLNPGRIVRAPRMDDRSAFRYGPDYRVPDLRMALSWSAFPGAGGGFQGAVEMCNNNGACRKLQGGLMCPSYRVTRDERDTTRGRANSLRLAMSGQLGTEALASDEMAEAMSLCVSCKACRRECPTGVDMARMKIEVAASRAAAQGLTLRDRMLAYLPRYAPGLSRLPVLPALRNVVPGAALLGEKLTGIAARRSLPPFAWRPFRARRDAVGPADGPEVALFVDTFSTWLEPRIPRAAVKVLTAAGYRVLLPRPLNGDRRPLCCGRTFLAAGLVEEAKYEARRTAAVLGPLARRGVPVVGLEPSCLLTFRDELGAMLPGVASETIAGAALLFDEFLARETFAGRADLPLRCLEGRALLHGHCHQKAFGAMPAAEAALALVPGLDVETIDSGCCGMAGAFGYQAETYEVSVRMAEQGLLPAVRGAGAKDLVVANGTSCRHQIADGAARKALHVAEVIASRLERRTRQAGS